MILLGLSAVGVNQPVLATNVDNINTVKLTNLVCDELFLSSNPDIELDETNKQWDYDTLFFAKFNGNLLAGNIDYSFDSISSIKIKRRENNSYYWITLVDKEVIDRESLRNIVHYDKFGKGNTKYEYAVVPVLGNVEGNYSTNTIESSFDSYYLVEKDQAFPILYNAEIPNESINTTSGVISTLGRKYAVVINNGSSNYRSGTIKVAFIAVDDNSQFDAKNNEDFKRNIEEFLTNKKPKLLKGYNGKMIMLKVSGNIDIEYSQHRDLAIYSIPYVEIGDAENQEDLYYNNFVDTLE